MNETFDKLLENQDYWRDEAKASWANIEALEVGNSRLEEEIAELRKEIHRLQKKDEERLANYAERTCQLIEAQKELEKWQLLMINHTMGGAWESVADFIKDQRVEYMGLKLMKDPLEVPDLTSAKARIRKLAERKAKEAMETVAQGVSKLNLDLADWSKRQKDNEEQQDVAESDRLFIAPFVIDNLPTFQDFMTEARATVKSPGLEVRTLEEALTQGFAAGMETGQWYQVTDDGPVEQGSAESRASL